MALTPEEARDAQHARRLWEDEYFHALFDRLAKEFTERAIIISDPTQREESRLMVLAVGHLFNRVQADLARPIEDAQDQLAARSME